MGGGRTFRRIVVGVNGSELSRTALRWAAQEALLRDCPLDVVYGWQISTEPRPPEAERELAPPLDAYQRQATIRLEQVVAETLPAQERSRVTVHAIHKRAGRALVSSAEGADLLVVGACAHGRLASWLLGSVSDEALQAAPCAVVLVRAGCVHS